MCELYKVGILTSQMLEMSMEYLLNSPSEETLECACNILKHTGKAFSHVRLLPVHMAIGFAIRFDETK